MAHSLWPHGVGKYLLYSVPVPKLISSEYIKSLQYVIHSPSMGFVMISAEIIIN
jgi:hypothetical protein